jgi:hypothetical protein
MKTKQIAIMAFAVLLTAVFAAVAMAEEVSNETVPSEDIVISPADQTAIDEVNDELNESVSGLKIGWLKLDIWLTFNQEKKAEKELKLARLELIRAKIAAKNNDSEAMENAIQAHNRILERVKERINAIDGKATKEGIKDSAAKLVGLERAIEVHEARIAKLREILVSENLTDVQIEKIQNRIEQAENNTAHLKEVEQAKKDKLKTRLMAVANMTKEQADAEVDEIENAQNLSAVKKLVAETKSIRSEKAAEVISRVIEKLEARQNETGKNMSNAITTLTAVQQKLQTRANTLRSED